MGAWTKSEAEKQYREGADRFDSWFHSLPKGEQKRLRDGGVLPYAEQPKPEYVFQPQPNHPVFVHDPSKEEARTEHDTFYSREKVAEFTARLLDTLATSPSRDVRLHLELVRIALRDAKAMTNEALARHYRLTRAAVNLRVQKLRRALTLKNNERTTQRQERTSKTNSVLQCGIHEGQVSGQRGKAERIRQKEVSINKREKTYSTQGLENKKQGKARIVKGGLDTEA
jgi:hypothetical protein